MTSFFMNLKKMHSREPNPGTEESYSPRAERVPRMLTSVLLGLLSMPAAQAEGCSEKLLIGAYGVSGGGTAIGVGPVALWLSLTLAATASWTAFFTKR